MERQEAAGRANLKDALSRKINLTEVWLDPAAQVPERVREGTIGQVYRMVKVTKRSIRDGALNPSNG
jgi:hypothetical protein